EFGAETVLVDGASDRVTQAVSAPGAGYVFVLRACGAGLARAAERARQLVAFDAIAQAPDPLPDAFCIDGAFTPAVAETVAPGAAVVLNDFTRVFLSPREFAVFSAARSVYFRRRIPLLFICVVLQDAEKAGFLRLFDCARGERYLLFNPYEAAHG
ncbi:MAG: hypothetical protein PHW69_09125, partial [Elusimicrobiaceae bacterium]|nr:hypothetical protein [Elusimicrobiaceae bacterium]